MADGNVFNVRGHAMFDNLAWHLSHLPKNAKVIVWCATVHAVKGAMPNSTNVPMATSAIWTASNLQSSAWQSHDR